MSIKGGAYPRFRRALEHGNPLVVRAAAAELGAPLSLADALAVTLVLLSDTRPRYERAAARWAARLALETPRVGLGEPSSPQPRSSSSERGTATSAPARCAP